MELLLFIPKPKLNSIEKDKGHQFKVNCSWIYIGSHFISLQIPSKFSDICDKKGIILRICHSLYLAKSHPYESTLEFGIKHLFKKRALFGFVPLDLMYGIFFFFEKFGVKSNKGYSCL